MGLLSALAIIPKIKTPEARDLQENMWKNSICSEKKIIFYNKTISFTIF